METEALRTLTRDACTRMNATLWPNGLGFSSWGWDYTYDERARDWCAVYRRGRSDLGSKVGHGPTPEAAKAGAK